jgi:hypothetical protein
MLTSRISQKLCHLFWPRGSSQELPRRYDEYLGRAGLGKQGSRPVDEPEMIPVNTGQNTLVRCLKHSAHEKLYARAWRYDRIGRPALTHVSAARCLGKAGLHVPDILIHDDSFKTIRQYRLETVIEKKADGVALHERIQSAPGPLPGALIETLARELTRLHGFQGSGWGSPWSTRDEMRKPLEYWLGRIGKVSRRIRAGTRLLSPGQVDRLSETLEHMLELVRFIHPVLVHGDLSPSHLFIDEKTKVTLIDFETVHFGHPAIDLASARNWFRDPSQWEIFLDLYATGPEVSIDVCALEYFTLMRLAEKLSSRIVKRTHRPGKLTGKRDERLGREQEQVENSLLGLLDQ